MTEQELRALVRDAIGRHAGGAITPAGSSTAVAAEHASHLMFELPAGADTDGPCLIEPSVPCTHCGYCKSYGH